MVYTNDMKMAGNEIAGFFPVGRTYYKREGGMGVGLEQYSKATLETAKNLRIIDDAMFRLIAEKPDVCQEILRTLLDMPGLIVEQVIAQSVVPSLHREITLDAHCILENGEHVNIEIQKGNENDDILRTRFHAAALTAACTPKGTDFSEVPQVTVLYITAYDALHNKRTFTHVKRCMETADGFVPVDDREDIFFANAEVEDGSDKAELLQLFLRKEAFHDEKYPSLSRAFSYYKETEGGQKKMCNIIEEYAKDYAKEYGQKCREDGRKTTIYEMVQDGDCSIERGAQKLGLSQPEFEAAMEKAGYRVPETV